MSSLAINLACTFCSSRQQTVAGKLAKDFWEDGRPLADELILLSHRAGKLGAVTFEQLAEVAGNAPILAPKPRLASESDDTRALIIHRLDLLRRSAKRRAAYVEMLGGAWEEFRPTWQRGARQADLAVSRFRAQLEAGVPWQELPSTPKTGEFLPQVLAKVGYDVPIILVPALSFSNMFILDVDDRLAVATPVPQGPDDRANEELTRQLKALAHPTRLAVIRSLTSEVRSVGELARSFDVAQPTMTNHVKVLRDAGLVLTDDASGRRALRVDTGSVRRVLDELSSLANAEGQLGDQAGSETTGRA